MMGQKGTETCALRIRRAKEINMRVYIVHAYKGRQYLCVAIGGRAFATSEGAQRWIDTQTGSAFRYEIEKLSVYDD